MKHLVLKFRFVGLVAIAMLAGVWPVAAQAAATGAADGFAVLASTAVTCTGSTVDGPVGVASSTTAVTLTPPNCALDVRVAPGAYADFISTYEAIAANLFPCKVLSGTLDGARLGPGTYCFDAAATLTGTLTLTGSGPWVFEIGTSGTGALTANSLTVVGSNPCNVTWWVRQAVTLTTSTFQGTILAGTSITLTGTTLDGRAWATMAVTMTDSSISGCIGAGTATRQHCNQGVGNGPEGCDPGNSNNKLTSNDENGGTQGDPGRQGGK